MLNNFQISFRNFCMSSLLHFPPLRLLGFCCIKLLVGDITSPFSASPARVLKLRLQDPYFKSFCFVRNTLLWRSPRLTALSLHASVTLDKLGGVWFILLKFQSDDSKEASSSSWSLQPPPGPHTEFLDGPPCSVPCTFQKVAVCHSLSHQSSGPVTADVPQFHWDIS